jgi:hypothetical protein
MIIRILPKLLPRSANSLKPRRWSSSTQAWIGGGASAWRCPNRRSLPPVIESLTGIKFNCRTLPHRKSMSKPEVQENLVLPNQSAKRGNLCSRADFGCWPRLNRGEQLAAQVFLDLDAYPAITNKRPRTVSKSWIWVIVTLPPFLGGLIYFFIGRPRVGAFVNASSPAERGNMKTIGSLLMSALALIAGPWSFS